MRIDNPIIEGALTLPADAGASGSFSGSFTGDGSGLTGITDSPLVAGTGVTKVGNTVSIGQDVSTTSSVTFGAVTATTGSFVLQLFESSSTIIHSGSNTFGDENTDTQQFTGSILISGSGVGAGSSITATGSINISGSLGVGTAASGVVGAILATNDVVAFSTSDERLKDNVVTIGSAVEKVEALNGVTFDWIPMEGIHVHSGHDMGVIAQEVEAVLPELVTTRDNGYKAVKYDKLTAVLIEAVKELSERVRTLEG